MKLKLQKSTMTEHRSLKAKIARAVLAAVVLLALSQAAADDPKHWRHKEMALPFEQLPQAIQEYVNTNFAGKEVRMVWLYTDFYNRDYKVFFADGDHIKFDEAGQWEEIRCEGAGEVPSSCIPEQITNFTKQFFPNAKIVEIKYKDDGRRIKVKLKPKIELEFDAQYNIVDIDD